MASARICAPNAALERPHFMNPDVTHSREEPGRYGPITGRWSYGSGSCADQRWVTDSISQWLRANFSSAAKRSGRACPEPAEWPSPPTITKSPRERTDLVPLPALIDIDRGGEPERTWAATQYERCALSRAKYRPRSNTG